MGAIGRNLLIIVIVVLAIAVGGYFLLPSSTSKTQTFNVDRPPASVFARLSSAPPGTVLAPGITETSVTRPPNTNNVVVAQVTYGNGSKGTATYTVTPEGAGSHVEMKLDQGLGWSPVDRVQGLISGGQIAPLAQTAATAVTVDLNALPKTSFAGLQYSVVQVAPQPFFYIQNCSPTDADSVKSVVQQALVAVRAVMAANNLRQAGDPIAVEPKVQAGQYCYQIGYPYEGTPPHVLAVGTAGMTPSGTMLRVVYKGSEEDVLDQVYNPLDALLAAAHLDDPKTQDDDWATYEVYHDDPTQAGGSHDREVFYVTKGDISRLSAIVAPVAAASQDAVPAATTPAAAPAAATTTATTATTAATTTATTTAAAQ